MNETVCGALGGRFDGNECDVPAGGSPAALALVTESLGSKLVSDCRPAHLERRKQQRGQDRDQSAGEQPCRDEGDVHAGQSGAFARCGGLGGDGQGIGAAAAVGAAKMRTTAGDVFGLLSRARRQALPGGRANDRGRVFRSQRSPDLPDHSGASGRGPQGIPRHQRSRIERHHLLRISGTSRHGTLRLSLESARVFGMLARGYQAGKPLPSVSGCRAGTCPNYIWSRAP